MAKHDTTGLGGYSRYGKAARAAVLLLALAAWTGCASSASESFSDSSKSISNSFSSPFESSSDSSGDGGDASYRQDVEDYTVAALQDLDATPLDADGFARGLARIAEAHGLSDWAAADGTYRAVGVALQRSGLTVDGALATGRRLFGDDPRGQSLLLEGFRAAGRPS